MKRITLFLLAASMIWIACNKQAENSTAKGLAEGETNTKGNITIAVDESFRPIIEEEIEIFESFYTEAKINALYLPNEQAIDSMIASSDVRLAISSRKLTSAENKQLTNQQASGRTFKIATDALSLIVHKKNPDSILTVSQLQGILSGDITSWKQINPASSLDTIVLVFDNPQSATVRYFQDKLLDGENIEAKAYSANSNPEVINFVKDRKDALGIIGVSWITDNNGRSALGFKQPITVVGFRKDKPCNLQGNMYSIAQPYQALIKTACYPLIREIFVINREPSFGLGTGFVSHLTSEQGQRIILKAGLVPDKVQHRVVEFPEKEQQ